MAVIALLVLLFSSCSGDSDGSVATELIASAEDMEARVRSEAIQVEEFVAECMKAQGFEYEPSPVSVIPRSEAEDVATYAAQYGYGISTGQFADVWLEDTFVPTTIEIRGEGEIESFQSALESADGCQFQAYNEVANQPFSLASQTDVLSAVFDAVETDPRALSIFSEWSSCMAEEGYDALAKPSDAYDSASSLFLAFRAEVEQYRFDEAGPAPDLEDTALIPALDGPLAEEFDRLREKEIQLATADVRCMEPWRSDFNNIQTRYLEEALG